jgi:hypothetical protein
MEIQELIIVDVFCQEYQIEKNLINDLESFGLIETIVFNENKYLDKNQIVHIERIIRLHNDLNINKEGIEIILDLLEKEKQLLSEIKYLKNRLGLYE